MRSNPIHKLLMLSNQSVGLFLAMNTYFTVHLFSEDKAKVHLLDSKKIHFSTCYS